MTTPHLPIARYNSICISFLTPEQEERKEAAAYEVLKRFRFLAVDWIISGGVVFSGPGQLRLIVSSLEDLEQLASEARHLRFGES